MTIFKFESKDKLEWLNAVANYVATCPTYKQSAENGLGIDFGLNLRSDDLQPFHLVTLACLIQYYKQEGFMVYLLDNNHEIFTFLYNDLGFARYWQQSNKQADCTRQDIFNLWHIEDNEKDVFVGRVTSFFKRNVSAYKDFTPITTGLSEAFCNIFDHANANGIAFCLMQYNRDTSYVQVAICDFGITIPASVSKVSPGILDDSEALAKAVERNFTVASKAHNRGFGLDNILTCADSLCLISRNGFLSKNEDGCKKHLLNYPFMGTLVEFEISLSCLEDEDVNVDLDF